MSAPTTPACPLGLSADDLSAWRDRALAPAEEQRIAAHVSGCVACQRIIAAHETLAAAVRADQPPAPDPRAWPHLQARIASSQKPHRGLASPTVGHAPRPAVWGGLGAAAAVLLLSALFLHLFAQQALVRGGSSHTATAATPPPLSAAAPTTPIVGPTLSWQTRMAPESVIPPPGNQTYNNGFAFSPTDAETAYICATTNAINAPNTIWATHDGAQTWTHVSDIPYAGEVAECDITVDAADPLRLTVMLSQQGLNGKSLITSEISDDGGQTWRTLNDDVLLRGLATRENTSVAVDMPLDSIVNNTSTSRPARLSASTDDWRSWQPIDGPLVAQGYLVSDAWLRPGDGALLAEAVQRQTATATTTSGSAPGLLQSQISTLWQSTDDGAHWTSLPTPPNLVANQGFVVAQPQGDAPWRVCGLEQSGSGSAQSGMIGCSLDGGQTWAARPLPALQAPCVTGGAGCLQQQTAGQFESALMPDGALVSVFYAGPNGPNVVQTLSMFHIFRLPPEADQWQDLGSQPGNALAIISSGAAGTLVGYSGGSSLDGYGGSLVGHLGGDVPNRGALAIARLP